MCTSKFDSEEPNLCGREVPAALAQSGSASRALSQRRAEELNGQLCRSRFSGLAVRRPTGLDSPACSRILPLHKTLRRMQAPGCDKTCTPPKSYLPQSDLYEGKSTLCITEGNLLARKFDATGLASSQQEGRSEAWSREIRQIFTGGPDKNIAIEVLLFSRRATFTTRAIPFAESCHRKKEEYCSAGTCAKSINPYVSLRFIVTSI